MNYKIIIRKPAQKFIEKQDRKTQKRLFKAINELPKGDVKKLRGSDTLYRLRVGTFRVLFEVTPISIEVTMIDVTDVDNRGQVYKR